MFSKPPLNAVLGLATPTDGRDQSTESGREDPFKVRVPKTKHGDCGENPVRLAEKNLNTLQTQHCTLYAITVRSVLTVAVENTLSVAVKRINRSR